MDTSIVRFILPPARLPGALLALVACAALAEEPTGPEGLRVITPEELQNFTYEGQPEWADPVIEDLSLSQQFIMDAQRREARSLMSRHLGIINLRGTRADLLLFQQMIDRELIEADDVKGWQAVGVLLGDVLANELDLHWVSYEDELGTSRALRWRNTDNFVFPITLLSRRLQFKQAANVAEIFAAIEQDVRRFIEYERTRPSFDAEP